MIPLLREIRFFKELAKAIYLTSFFSVFESVWKKIQQFNIFRGEMAYFGFAVDILCMNALSRQR